MDHIAEALIVIAFILAFFGSAWLNDKDDARLDALRRTAIEACDDRTEGVTALEDCVTRTLAATGQPT